MTTAISDSIVWDNIKDIPGLMAKTTDMLDAHERISVTVRCCATEQEIKTVERALHRRFVNSGHGVVERQPGDGGGDDGCCCTTFLITRVHNEPTVHGTAKDICGLLGETIETIQDEHYAFVVVKCANDDEIKSVERALQRCFASAGRGVVERRPAGTEACDCTTFLVKHTNIGSDSENDPEINYDYKYDTDLLDKE